MIDENIVSKHEIYLRFPSINFPQTIHIKNVKHMNYKQKLFNSCKSKNLMRDSRK